MGSKFSMEQTMMHVVGEIAHHLQLEFLPAERALFDQDFVHRRKREAALQNLDQIFAVVGDAAAGAAQVKLGRRMHGKPMRARTRARLDVC
jgi:hypothetical protein